MKRMLLLISLLIISCLCLCLVACNSAETPQQPTGYSLNFNTVYALAEEAGYTGTLEELVEMFKGDNAYQLAVAAGYTGTQQEWLLTLRGAAGADGLTPTIGENKHWFVGDVDTGVVAEGKDGATGNGIDRIEKTGTEGLVDTYTIYFTDGSSTTFDVANGSAGISVVDTTLNEEGELIVSLSNEETINAGRISTDVVQHDFGEWIEILEMDCTNDGLRIKICADCGFTYSEFLQAPGHHYVDVAEVQPTCTTPGHSSYQQCTECGNTIGWVENYPAHGHYYGAWSILTDATTEQTGLKQRVCDLCGDVEEEVIPVRHVYNLRVWCSEADYEITLEMLAAYAEANSNNVYNWTVERLGEDIAPTAVTRDVSEAADVFSFNSDQLGNLVRHDALSALPSTYSSTISNDPLGAFFESAYRIYGTTYAFPYAYECCLLFYNKSLLSSTQVQSMDSILNASIAGVTANLGMDMTNSYYTSMFLNAAGIDIFGKDSDDVEDVNLANDNAVNACRYIASLGSNSKFVSIDKQDQYAALRSGRVAAVIAGPQMIASFKEALGDNYGVFVLPTVRFEGDEEDTGLVGFSSLRLFGVSRKSTNERSQLDTNEAFKVAAYLSNTNNQQKRLEERDLCPIAYSILVKMASGYNENTSIEDVEHIEAMATLEQIGSSKLIPSLIEMSNYWEPMSAFLLGVYKLNYTESVWLGELTKIENKLRGD